MMITQQEREYLRELAKQQMEYAMLPIMREREKKWYKHNDLNGDVPMIHLETNPFEQELLPSLKCQTEEARLIELTLLRMTTNHLNVNDDKPIPTFLSVPWNVHFSLFNLNVSKTTAKDSNGRVLGQHFNHPITDLKIDYPKLDKTLFWVDREKTLGWKAILEDVVGDIIPVKLITFLPVLGITMKIVHFMGMENMLYSVLDYPYEFHQIMNQISDDMIACLKWMESENLLLTNNHSHRVGQGTFGFTNDLPSENSKKTGIVTLKDIWGYTDSQETVSISPEMFGEFFFPYYKKIADNFGLLNYGCCEPVHSIWNDYLSKFTNLRKVSISPWCDEEFMGEALRGSNVIFHRKPSPNFLGIQKEFDEAAFTKHILKTLNAANGCKLEITFRDIYTLSGNIPKAKRAVEIVRNLIDKHWKP